MNYEKEYNKLVGKIKKAHLYVQTDSTRAVLEDIYPELAESEDERIRKRLIEYFEGFRIGNAEVKWEGLNVQDVLDWLEKQKGNPKSADSIPSDCVSDAKCEDRWMADLERTYRCNPDKLPKWLKDDIARKELNAHTKGYNKGYKDAEKRYNESVAYHYPDPIPPGVAYKSPQYYTDVLITPNTNSGTSTLKAEG